MISLYSDMAPNASGVKALDQERIFVCITMTSQLATYTETRDYNALSTIAIQSL